MENIFKNAQFGKMYKTRNGGKAIYLRKNDFHNHILSVGSHEIVVSWEDGALLGCPRESIYDIISEWKEPVDEKKLDKHVTRSYPNENHQTSFVTKQMQNPYRAHY